MKFIFSPLFDNLNNIHKNLDNVVLPSPNNHADFTHSLDFLKCYTGSLGTFNSYRREVERLLQWCWNIQKTRLKELKREDIENYIRFCQNPPDNWISIKKVPRFLEKAGLRSPNPDWRPFVANIPKASKQLGMEPNINQYSLTQGAVQEIFAILSTYFNFLVAEEYIYSNPIALMRQKSKFIRKRQLNTPIRRLSLLQWQTVIKAAETLAFENPDKHERTLFILSILFGMYLRISEVVASTRWVPAMNDFAKDNNGDWWFTTVGKGNKERQIAVSDQVLDSLRRWRLFLGLSALPSPGDNAPLIPRLRGSGPMSDTAPIRRLVQLCFDLAAEELKKNNHIEEANILAEATVHWLRHTGISEDVKIRPREHVRDDAGHSSSVTTDKYIDVEMKARHTSARKKVLVPN